MPKLLPTDWLVALHQGELIAFTHLARRYWLCISCRADSSSPADESASATDDSIQERPCAVPFAS